MVGESGREEIDRLIRGGLAEGYRLAAEAREAIRSRYEDWNLVIILAGLLLWGSLLLFVISGAIAAGAWIVLASLLAVVALCVPLFLFSRSRFRRELDAQERWLERLRAPRDEAGSTFDLLVEVSEQVPLWLAIKQRNRFKDHPLLIAAAFISGIAVTSISLQICLHTGDSSLPYLVLMLLPFLAILVASILAVRSATRRERERVLARWRERMESSRRAMEEMLGGL